MLQDDLMMFEAQENPSSDYKSAKYSKSDGAVLSRS